MDNVVHVVLAEHHRLQVLPVHDVGALRHHLVNELAAFYHCAPLLICHDGAGPFAFANRFVTVDANNEVSAEIFALPEGIHVPVMHHVEGAVHPYSHRLGVVRFCSLALRCLRMLLLQLLNKPLRRLQVSLKVLSAPSVPSPQQQPIQKQSAHTRHHCQQQLFRPGVRWWDSASAEELVEPRKHSVRFWGVEELHHSGGDV
mmetsp:Transcript_38716/g.76226  ORF Transcript_38716/g.76226 Transcript_38716/m.76226 type:complete len:201 (-) Transcript_38716:78-680(-)